MPRHPDACLGPCNKRYHRAWNTHDQNITTWQTAHDAWQQAREAHPHNVEPEPQPPLEPTIRPWLGDPHWCETCTATVRRAITEIDQLANILGAWSDGHRGVASGQAISHRRADAGSPSPIALTLDELYAVVVAVEDGWRDRCGYPAVRRGTGRGPDMRSRALGFVALHLDSLLATSMYRDLGTQLLTWERLLQALTKSEPFVRARPGRCPGASCHRIGQLYIEDGKTACRACGHCVSEEDYQTKVLPAAFADGALVKEPVPTVEPPPEEHSRPTAARLLLAALDQHAEVPDVLAGVAPQGGEAHDA